MQNKIIDGYHVPVLLEECLEGLNIKESGIYADLTFGGGGHSSRIVERLGENGHLYGFDQDVDSERNAINDSRFTFVRSNFRYLSNFMKYYGVEALDGILADLGVSSHHLDDESRGFSFRFDSELDMRMNYRAGKTAADVLNDYDEEKLADVFYLYGEMKNARRIAAAIVKSRSNMAFRKVSDLLAVVKPFIPAASEKKELARLFQALRIEVNNEMDALRDMLESTIDVLKPGGRLVIMTYHSLEDRMVKNFMKTGNVSGKVEQDLFGRSKSFFKLINNKVIVPSDEEINVNPRSRSAKLRIAEKL